MKDMILKELAGVDTGITYSHSDMAKVLDISRQWVIALAKQGVLTRDINSQYSLIDSIHRYINHIRNKAKRGLSDSETSLTIEKETLRLTTAKANKEEINNKIRILELIPACDIEEAWGKIGAEIKSNMLGLPNKLSHLVACESDISKINDIIKAAVVEGLECLSSMDITDIIGDDRE